MDSDSHRDREYELVVRGELDDRYASLFEGMQMDCIGGTTVLVGRIRDRAQLYGFIERIEELGLELVSVQQAGGDPQNERDGNEA